MRRDNYRTNKTYWAQPVFSCDKIKKRKKQNFVDFKTRKNREASAGQVGSKDIPLLRKKSMFCAGFALRRGEGKRHQQVTLFYCRHFTANIARNVSCVKIVLHERPGK
jgi:hypothetical protein